MISKISKYLPDWLFHPGVCLATFMVVVTAVLIQQDSRFFFGFAFGGFTNIVFVMFTPTLIHWMKSVNGQHREWMWHKAIEGLTHSATMIEELSSPAHATAILEDAAMCVKITAQREGEWDELAYKRIANERRPAEWQR